MWSPSLFLSLPPSLPPPSLPPSLPPLSLPPLSLSLSPSPPLSLPPLLSLLDQLKKVVVNGDLPVTLDEAIFLTALQMHIEVRGHHHNYKQRDISHIQMVAEPSPFIGRLRNRGNSSSAGTLHRISARPHKKSFTGKLKSTLPSGYTKSKPLMKRVKGHMTEMESLSERNAKHLFIERCQVLPGYECSLYHVRVPQGARFRKEAKQILGVSSKRVVFLEEKTKV